MSDSDELVVVHVAASQAEAEIPLSALRAAGIDCMVRPGNRAVAVGQGLSSWGPQELLVRRRDETAARDVLGQDEGTS